MTTSCVYTCNIYTYTCEFEQYICTHTHAPRHPRVWDTNIQQNSRVWKSPEELENQPDNINNIRLQQSVAHMNDHIYMYIFIYVYIYICTYIYILRPLLLPWGQTWCDVSRQLYQVCARKRAVYWSGNWRGSTMQTTTAVSADVPAQTQHITKGRSLWIKG